MPKPRAVTGHGPMVFTLSTTGSSAWRDIGPVVANRISGEATFTGTTGIVKLQGRMSTASTGTVALLQHTFAQRSTIRTSTVTNLILQVRVNSTSLQASQSIRLVVAAAP